MMQNRENEIGNILSFTAPFCRGFERKRELTAERLCTAGKKCVNQKRIERVCMWKQVLEYGTAREREISMNYGAFGCKYANVRMCRVCKIESVVATNSIQCSLRDIFFPGILQYVHETTINAGNIRASTTRWIRCTRKRKKHHFSTYRKCNAHDQTKKEIMFVHRIVCNAVVSGMVKMEGKRGRKKTNKRTERKLYVYIITRTTAPFFPFLFLSIYQAAFWLALSCFPFLNLWHTTLVCVPILVLNVIAVELSPQLIESLIQPPHGNFFTFLRVFLYGHLASAFIENEI